MSIVVGRKWFMNSSGDACSAVEEVKAVAVAVVCRLFVNDECGVGWLCRIR